MCLEDIPDIEEQVGYGKWWLRGGIHHDWDMASSHYLLIAIFYCLPGKLKMSSHWKKSVYLTGFWLRFDYSCLHIGRVSVHYLCCFYEKTEQSYVESLLNKISWASPSPVPLPNQSLSPKESLSVRTPAAHLSPSSLSSLPSIQWSVCSFTSSLPAPLWASCVAELLPSKSPPFILNGLSLWGSSA